MILNVVVHHRHPATGARQTRELGDDHRHLLEIIGDEADHMRVAELRLSPAQRIENLGESGLRGDRGLRARKRVRARIVAIEPGALGPVLDRRANRRLPQRAEGGPVVTEPGQLQSVGARVVVTVGVRRRCDRQPHAVVFQPRQLRERRPLDDAGREAAVTFRQMRRVAQDLGDAPLQRFREAGERPPCSSRRAASARCAHPSADTGRPCACSSPLRERSCRRGREPPGRAHPPHARETPWPARWSLRFPRGRRAR